jgi:hypothetical protein
MSVYFLYTGETKEQARVKAQTNLDQINTNFEELSGGVFCDNIEEMTANPIINGITYYYGIETPPECAMTNVTYDYECEYNYTWKSIIEEGE